MAFHCVNSDICDDSPACKLKMLASEGGCPAAVYAFENRHIVVKNPQNCLVVKGKSCQSKSNPEITICESACPLCIKIARDVEQKIIIDKWQIEEKERVFEGKSRNDFLSIAYVGTEPHSLHKNKSEIVRVENNGVFELTLLRQLVSNIKREASKHFVILEIVFNHSVICRAATVPFDDFISPASSSINGNYSHYILYVTTKEAQDAVIDEFKLDETPVFVVTRNETQRVYPIGGGFNAGKKQEVSNNFLIWLNDNFADGGHS